MAGYLVKKQIRALGIGLIRRPGQQVSDGELATVPALRDALIEEGALVPIDGGGMNALMSIEGMRSDWASHYYAYGFRTAADIANASVDELREADGVGPATARDLVAAAKAGAR